MKYRNEANLYNPVCLLVNIYASLTVSFHQLNVL